MGRAGRESCGSDGVLSLFRRKTEQMKEEGDSATPVLSCCCFQDSLSRRSGPSLELFQDAPASKIDNLLGQSNPGRYSSEARRSPAVPDRGACDRHSLRTPCGALAPTHPLSCVSFSRRLLDLDCVCLPYCPRKTIKYHNALICPASEPIKSEFLIFYIFPVPHPLN